MLEWRVLRIGIRESLALGKSIGIFRGGIVCWMFPDGLTIHDGDALHPLTQINFISNTANFHSINTNIEQIIYNYFPIFISPFLLLIAVSSGVF